MDEHLIALADPARWRLVSLLAERPRPVGVLAQLAGARQPQTTKHLQTLERAGLVTSRRSGQRRIYALQPAHLRVLADQLVVLADAADRAAASYDHYGQEVEAERAAASRSDWYGDRSFAFSRTLAGRPDEVWRHLTDPDLLARWWAPDDLRVCELVFEPRPGGRVLLAYRDAGDADGSDTEVGRAEGTVEEVRAGERLVYTSSPFLPDGSRAFTDRVEMTLQPVDGGTALAVRHVITDSQVDSAEFIAGIEIGVGQTLDKLTHLINDNPARSTT